MDPLKAAILGVVQGLTEFLPVSSSGHLVIFQHLFGLNEPELFFDVCLHLGTLFAVCIFVRKELLQILLSLVAVRGRIRATSPAARQPDPNIRLFVLVCIGTLVTGVFALTFKDELEGLFASPFYVGIALMGTGVILTLSKWAKPSIDRISEIRFRDSALIGLGQGLAVIPGISRSGTTITLGLLLHLDRELAARFSFLLFIPAILGAAVLQFDSGRVMGEPVSLAVGTLSAALSGYLALNLLLKLVRVGKFWIFAPYCFILGLVTVFYYRG